MKHDSREQGFSLIELMMAVALTLVVSGAIFALLAGGQNAFRREPELTDRQQNIRLAMALIERDVVNAGAKLGAYTRAFTDGLDGVGPVGLDSQQSDFLEIASTNTDCPEVHVANTPGTSNNVNLTYQAPDCFPENSMVMLFYDNFPPMYAFAFNLHSGGTMVNFPPGQQPPNPSPRPSPPTWIQSNQELNGGQAGGPGPGPSRIAVMQIIRYEIAPGSDGAPSLYRSARGGITENGDYIPPPNSLGAWQLVARGIEDLQVLYQTGTDATIAANWNPRPFTPQTGAPLTVVRRVRITLAARSMVEGLQGETESSGVKAVRGQLVTEAAPREALLGLQATGNDFWR